MEMTQIQRVKLAGLLKKGRQEKGLSQEAVAEKMNMSRAALSQYEMGKAAPDFISMVAFSKLYTVPMDEFIACVCNGNADDEVSDREAM